MFPVFINWRMSGEREEKEKPYGRTVCAIEIVAKLFYLFFWMVLGGHSKHREGNTGKVSFTFTASCAECENSVVSRKDKSL